MKMEGNVTITPPQDLPGQTVMFPEKKVEEVKVKRARRASSYVAIPQEIFEHHALGFGKSPKAVCSILRADGIPDGKYVIVNVRMEKTVSTVQARSVK